MIVVELWCFTESAKAPCGEGRGSARTGPLLSRHRGGAQGGRSYFFDPINRYEQVVERALKGGLVGTELRVELDGEYDLSRRQELASLFASLEGESPLVIDMTKVTYIDSTILHELSTLRERDRGRAITLLGSNASVRRILEIVSFDRIFEIR
jgi:anti-anti-sigma factor